MTVKELYDASPQSFVFIRRGNGKVYEYEGTKDFANNQVETVKATSYPMFHSILEITIKN